MLQHTCLGHVVLEEHNHIHHKSDHHSMLLLAIDSQNHFSTANFKNRIKYDMFLVIYRVNGYPNKIITKIFFKLFIE